VPMRYPAEVFTDEEQLRLTPYFTNLDKPVFAVVNLPETVKGALFARYSRYGGTLRRLFLDEFADTLPHQGANFERGEGERARALYERIFIGYGDDSVAQLGGAHIACEWASNVLTKILQRPRIAGYLEQSTRYIQYDRPVDGLGNRYYRDPSFGPEYADSMDSLFRSYSEGLRVVSRWAAEEFPRANGESAAAHARAVGAKALDLVRGLLPASSLSHVGIYASGQTYEQLLLHLFAHPLAEARAYGQMILGELEAVMPSFVARVPRPDRGGRWVEYLRERERRALSVAERLGVREREEENAPSVRLLRVDGSEEELLAALLFEASTGGEEATLEAVRGLAESERTALLAELMGGRENRRHRPGRGLEALRYRFEIISDYGAFRDLQRHRMLTIQWRPLSPDLGADIPAELQAAGFADQYAEALELSRTEYERLRDRGFVDEAMYALCFAYRIRYVLDLNAREAMHLVELRSGLEGHPAYRAVAHEMRRLIGEVHPAVARAMEFVDATGEPRLERLLAEIRNETRAAERAVR
jgi:thymidylate synthase ThyX